MTHPAPVPRNRLGEVCYQLLWWGALLLPFTVCVLRALVVTPSELFFLFVIIGAPLMAILQVVAGATARAFRMQQWRHWLGPVASYLSMGYYAAWLLLALTLPESSDGDGSGTLPAGVLIVLLPLSYAALLASIVVEGRAAVRYGSATRQRPAPETGAGRGGVNRPAG